MSVEFYVSKDLDTIAISIKLTGFTGNSMTTYVSDMTNV